MPRKRYSMFLAMKKTFPWTAFFSIPLIIAAFFLLIATGCETSSPDEAQITIEPAYTTIRTGQSITLKASGWHRYKWSLKNNDIGRLSATTGETVVYTALESGTQTVFAHATTETVTTTGSGTNATTTSSSRIAGGTATIKH